MTEVFWLMSRSLFSDRPEVACIMHEVKAISKANGGALKTLDDRLTVHEYSLFWNTFQKSEVDSYMDEEAAKGVFQQIVGDETADSIDTMEFAMLLDASENSVFDPAGLSLVVGWTPWKPTCRSPLITTGSTVATIRI
jgi:hypothetical protein